MKHPFVRARNLVTHPPFAPTDPLILIDQSINSNEKKLISKNGNELTQKCVENLSIGFQLFD